MPRYIRFHLGVDPERTAAGPVRWQWVTLYLESPAWEYTMGLIALVALAAGGFAGIVALELYSQARGGPAQKTQETPAPLVSGARPSDAYYNYNDRGRPVETPAAPALTPCTPEGQPLRPRTNILCYEDRTGALYYNYGPTAVIVSRSGITREQIQPWHAQICTTGPWLPSCHWE